MCADDAIEFMMAGATAVAVGTATVSYTHLDVYKRQLNERKPVCSYYIHRNIS